MARSLLFIDNDLDVRQTVMRFFIAHGFTTVTAPDNETGYRLARSGRFDHLLIGSHQGRLGYVYEQSLTDRRLRQRPVIVIGFGPLPLAELLPTVLALLQGQATEKRKRPYPRT